MKIMQRFLLGLLALLPALAVAGAPASAQQQKPNILVIMGDDIGYWNISAYNHGQMGYRTPNIDRIATEGAIFTDYYGQQSCTAGRAAFITAVAACEAEDAENDKVRRALDAKLNEYQRLVTVTTREVSECHRRTHQIV
jgi:Sulfatase